MIQICIFNNTKDLNFQANASHMRSILWIQVEILGLSPEKKIPRIYRRDCGVWLWGKQKS